MTATSRFIWNDVSIRIKSLRSQNTLFLTRIILGSGAGGASVKGLIAEKVRATNVLNALLSVASASQIGTQSRIVSHVIDHFGTCAFFFFICHDHTRVDISPAVYNDHLIVDHVIGMAIYTGLCGAEVERKAARPSSTLTLAKIFACHPSYPRQLSSSSSGRTATEIGNLKRINSIALIKRLKCFSKLRDRHTIYVFK